ncbi:hypothetical protein Tco_0369329 [Tanacetum coccineum]
MLKQIEATQQKLIYSRKLVSQPDKWSSSRNWLQQKLVFTADTEDQAENGVSPREMVPSRQKWGTSRNWLYTSQKNLVYQKKLVYI